MRIKIRLYARDLDLVALKHNKLFSIGSAIRTALIEYVRRGECTKISVPPTNLEQIVLQEETVNIALDQDAHADVIAWLNGIRNGMKSYAIKAIFRSAIANPMLDLFQSGSNLVLPKNASTQNLQQVVAKEEQVETSVGKSAENPVATETETTENHDAQETTVNLFEDMFELY